MGPAVEVEYVDLADRTKQGEYPEMVAMVDEQRLPYPLVAINGQVKLAGSAHYFRVLPLVEEALATERQP